MNKTTDFFNLLFLFKMFHDSRERNITVLMSMSHNQLWIPVQQESSEMQKSQKPAFKTKQNPTEVPEKQCAIHWFREKIQKHHTILFLCKNALKILPVV